MLGHRTNMLCGDCSCFGETFSDFIFFEVKWHVLCLFIKEGEKYESTNKVGSLCCYYNKNSLKTHDVGNYVFGEAPSKSKLRKIIVAASAEWVIFILGPVAPSTLLVYSSLLLPSVVMQHASSAFLPPKKFDGFALYKYSTMHSGSSLFDLFAFLCHLTCDVLEPLCDLRWRPGELLGL